MGRTNVNANRILTGGTDGSLNQTMMTIDTHLTGTPPVVQRAVVLDVVPNPQKLTQVDLEELRARVLNPEVVDAGIVQNSVVGLLITDGTSDSIPTVVLLAPFWQTHLLLPVQIGEQVQVVFDDYYRHGFKSGRWLSRAAESATVEDVNYTHSDRRFLLSEPSDDNGNNGPEVPSFPNGGSTENTRTVPVTSGPTHDNSGNNPYDNLWRQNPRAQEHVFEPVPRWPKRTDELVLQGANNSLLVLGRDRPGVATGSLGPTEMRQFAGTADLVVGRGRYVAIPPAQEPTSLTVARTATSPSVARNTRGLFETNKTARSSRLFEGEPDFDHDAARLYLSANTKGDINFKTVHSPSPNGSVNATLNLQGINYPENSLRPTQPTPDQRVPSVGTAYGILKSDHVRVIARRSCPDEDGLGQQIISGSVLIVKEGIHRTPDDINAQASPSNDHLAYMYITPDGRMQLDACQIFLGGAALRPGATQTPPPDMPLDSEPATGELDVGGPNMFAGAEPFIKWSEYKRVVEGLQRQLNALHNAFAGLVDDIHTASNGSLCQPMGPDVAWQGLTAAADRRAQTLSSDIEQHRMSTNQAVYRSRSAKVFGQ